MAKVAEAIIRPTTAQKIAAAEREIGSIEQEIRALEESRAAQLLDDDPAEALKLADRITAAQRRLVTHHDRIAAFAKQSKRERTDRRQQEKDQALAVFEKHFTERATAAGRVGTAIAELGASLKAYREACRRPFEPWPDTFPAISLFQDSVYSYLDMRIGGALHMHAPGAAYALLTDLPARLGDLTENEIKLGASLVESIKSAPLPKQYNTDDEGIAA
jgi:hypothetical protein